MKSAISLAALTFLLTGLGCGHVDLAPAGNPDRVLTGSVRAPAALPAGTEIVVRVVDPSPSMTPAIRSELPIVDRGRPAPSERILGEYRHTLTTPTIDPVPFKVEYHVDDTELRQGLNVDVRISHDGRVRYRTISAHVITLASSPFPQEVPVQALE
jgi:hypothetical protein